jgi:hypothetical protein
MTQIEETRSLKELVAKLIKKGWIGRSTITKGDYCLDYRAEMALFLSNEGQPIPNQLDRLESATGEPLGEMDADREIRTQLGLPCPEEFYNTKDW